MLMIICLCMSSSKTDIDELILLEQEVNLLNGPIVLLQLLRLLLPATEPFDLVFGNTGMGLKAKLSFPTVSAKLCAYHTRLRTW